MFNKCSKQTGQSTCQSCSLGHVDIAACICKNTLTNVGYTGHNLDEHHLIITRPMVNGQPIHDDCMLMGWGMNSTRMQLEHRLKCGMITVDEAHARWERCI